MWRRWRTPAQITTVEPAAACERKARVARGIGQQAVDLGQCAFGQLAGIGDEAGGRVVAVLGLAKEVGRAEFRIRGSLVRDHHGFGRARKKVDADVELITRKDYNRLAEYDALLIREREGIARLRRAVGDQHLFCGEVDHDGRVGADVVDIAVGQRVVVVPGYSCLTCGDCMAGRFDTCRSRKTCAKNSPAAR